ncbi:MAG: adenylyltransferase/cytidyltransferase family protein, partial [Clostridiales bacterium]|nr:adenylyltransferase/cytidyltransferase family protein [Clostridiales bacterium]
MQRIAIFPGVFDPVHIGHINVSRAVLDIVQADKIIFLPCSIPPYPKPSIEVNQRREMCRLAISGENDLYLADEAPLASGCNIIDSIDNLQDLNGKAEYY